MPSTSAPGFSVEEKFKAGETVTGEVIEVVKGGLILDIGLRGFLPASLVDLRRVNDLDMYLGTEIEARVIEMDRNRNNVVLSRRVLLEEGRKNERAEILSKLSKGMRLKGTVSSIVDFGAFVDLGGIDGLVHISELSWNHVNHPSEVVKVGDEVEVEVLDVDLQRERISLGLKQTTERSLGQARRGVPGWLHRRRQGHQDRSVRRVHRAGQRRRGLGAHLRDGYAPHRHPGAGRASLARTSR